jgi:rhamnose transport system permease protein
MSFKREWFTLGAYVLLLLLVALRAPGFFEGGNLRDVAVNMVPVLVAAIGMTMVILARQIDISIGSQSAICGVVAGYAVKAGLPIPVVIVATILAGGVLGSINGALVAFLGLPSIVVTLATMVAWREALRWTMEGATIRGLENFQWFGLSQAGGRAVILGMACVVFAAFVWGLKNLSAGRAVYAVGSDAEAARLVGIRPARVTFAVFLLMGMLTALAAVLSSVRFPMIQSTAGQGFELEVIAAVVVGGTAISGGRGTLWGTLIGVLLLGTIGTALTFLQISSYWGKAIQGAIILAAVAVDAIELKKKYYARAAVR